MEALAGIKEMRFERFEIEFAEEVVFVLLGQCGEEFGVVIEMVFDGGLTAAGDEQNLLDARDTAEQRNYHQMGRWVAIGCGLAVALLLLANLPGRSRRNALFTEGLLRDGRVRTFAGRLEMWPVAPLDDTPAAAAEMCRRLGLTPC